MKLYSAKVLETDKQQMDGPTERMQEVAEEIGVEDEQEVSELRCIWLTHITHN